MRFLSSRYRTAAEILLTVGVLAYVTYDLADLGGGSKPSSSAAATTTTAAAAFAVPSSSPHPEPAAAPATATASVRFDTQGSSSSITANNTYTVCNSITAPSNPWVVGSPSVSVNQSLVFVASASCTQTPAVLAPNASQGCASVEISPGSWLSLQNVVTPPLAGCVGLLTMDPSSYLEVVIPTTLVPNPYATQNFPLLVTQGSCPSSVAFIPSVSNCPVDTTTALTGPYSCSVTTTAAGNTCVIGLNIAGALVAQANTNIQVVMNKDCSTMTQTTFKAIITSVIGVSPQAIMITYWQCSSIVVIFTVLGASTTQARAVLDLIYASMQGGQLRALLAVTLVIYNPAPFPTAITVTSTYARPYYPIIPYPVLVSSSNPALFALLSLLVIPIAVAIALLVWWCYRNRVVPPPEPVCIPQCCPPPMPCPMPCPMPTCCPAPEPVCCTSTLMDPLYTPSPTPFTATPALL